MGWKSVKEYYKIEHIVSCYDDGTICIGSPYIHDIIKVSNEGKIIKSYLNDRLSSGNENLERYEAEMLKDLGKLKELVEIEDSFSNSITVYTYKDGEIIEEKCEFLGWPNLTHRGKIMYENMYSPDIEKVKLWAKSDAEATVSLRRKILKEKESDFMTYKKKYREAKEILLKANTL